MRWSILTPELSIHWDGETLSEGPGATRAEAPGGDPLEAMWKTYYASIFNPARLKVGAMLKEMPKKYWRNMPETSLVRAADRRRPSAGDRDDRKIEGEPRCRRRPEGRARGRARDRSRAETCARRGRRCSRKRAAAPAATSTSARRRRCSAKGRSTRRIMFVGEQPGDQEDLAGRPFVGPAGQVFDAALEKAGHRALRGLRHQCGQAFQVRAARQEAHPLQARMPARSRPAAGGSIRNAR